MNKIKIKCPAKINLTLKVVGKREDGFHNLESIMQTIDLYDYLTIETRDERLETSNNSQQITLSGTSDEIPYNEKNLVYKAAELFFSTVKSTSPRHVEASEQKAKARACLFNASAAETSQNHCDDKDIEILRSTQNDVVNIHIEKNIPIAAGLAGGSTDAAGTIYGLNKLFGEPLSRAQLHELCAKLGSDLNFCLDGGRAMTTSRGEILEPLPFEEFSVSLIKPINLGISAKEAYTKFSARRAKGEESDFVNDLEWAVIDDYMQLQEIKKLYPDAIMSGSGSTYFGVNTEFLPQTGYWVKNNLKAIAHGVVEA